MTIAARDAHVVNDRKCGDQSEAHLVVAAAVRTRRGCVTRVPNGGCFSRAGPSQPSASSAGKATAVTPAMAAVAPATATVGAAAAAAAAPAASSTSKARPGSRLQAVASGGSSGGGSSILAVQIPVHGGPSDDVGKLQPENRFTMDSAICNTADKGEICQMCFDPCEVRVWRCLSCCVR